MKFVNYNKDNECIVRIKVDINEEGLCIHAVNALGMSVSILAVLYKHGITLCKRVHPDLGFDLDEEGRLKVL